MKLAYVDSSIVLARIFGQQNDTDQRGRLAAFDELHSSVLIEAEVLSAARRERMPVEFIMLDRVWPVLPDRSLRPEIERVLAAGYVRGADCLHLATALYLTPDPAELTFLTLDERQRAVAVALGFAV